MVLSGRHLDSPSNRTLCPPRVKTLPRVKKVKNKVACRQAQEREIEVVIYTKKAIGLSEKKSEQQYDGW